METEGLLDKVERITADAEWAIEERGNLTLDDNARIVLRYGVLRAVTDKGADDE